MFITRHQYVLFLKVFFLVLQNIGKKSRQVTSGYCSGSTSLFFVVMYLAPLTLMMVLNGLLVTALRRSQQSRVTTLRSYLLTP